MTMCLFAKNSCKTHMYLYYKYTHWIDPCMMHKCWIYFHVFTFPFSSTAYKTVRLNPCATSWKSGTKERRLTKQILKSAKNSMGWKMCNRLEELRKIIQQSKTKGVSRNYHHLKQSFLFHSKAQNFNSLYWLLHKTMKVKWEFTG